MKSCVVTKTELKSISQNSHGVTRLYADAEKKSGSIRERILKWWQALLPIPALKGISKLFKYVEYEQRIDFDNL